MKKDYTDGQKNGHTSAMTRDFSKRFAATQALDNCEHDAV